MAQVVLSLPADGQTIDSSDINTPLNTLTNEFNGNIDNNNIKVGANIDGSKLAANSTPLNVLDATARQGWITGAIPSPTTITNNGNRSYDLLFSATDLTTFLSPGMRLRTTRTVAAPTQSASLNGTNQYFSKTAPAGMTFTDDFAVSAWVKVNAYAGQRFISRFDGTNGWVMELTSAGQITLYGNNGGAGNFSLVTSHQSVPLNKWVHVTAQLDMSAFTATPTTSYIMIDGIDVPAFVQRGGTNPTALIQAGNLNIGAANGLTYFNGKIAQAAIYSAKVTQATIRSYYSQGLTGTETSLISAYSLSNSLNDLNTTNANNLTALNGATTTNADAPFGGQADGTISSTLDYAIVQRATFSTNTTVTVQVPEGCTIPTSGGVSAVVYSSNKVPFGFPSQRNKWIVEQLTRIGSTQSSPTQAVWYNIGTQLNVPIGSWEIVSSGSLKLTATNGNYAIQTTISTTNNTQGDLDLTTYAEVNALVIWNTPHFVKKALDVPTSTVYFLNIEYLGGGAVSALTLQGLNQTTKIQVENAYL